MKIPQHIRPSNCPFRSEARALDRGERAYALLIIMMMVTLLLVSLTAALPSVYQEAQREKEEETIFRGTQYQWAIYLFHRQFQRYPTSVKELLETNGMHFLRKEYRDPLDPKGKWRFIHANAMGVLLDSKLQPLGPGGAGVPGASPRGMGGSTMMLGGPSGSGGSFFSSGGSSLSSGGSSFVSGGSTSSQGSSPTTGTTSETQESTSSSFANSSNAQGATSSSQSGSSSSFFGSGNQLQGAFIVGVAPTSHKQSIRVWNKRTHYDEWEFIGVDVTGLGFPTGIPGVQAAPTQGQPGFGTGQSPSGQGQSGFGTGSGQSGFGTGSGQGQSGFGSGQTTPTPNQPSQGSDTFGQPANPSDSSSPDNPPH